MTKETHRTFDRREWEELRRKREETLRPLFRLIPSGRNASTNRAALNIPYWILSGSFAQTLNQQFS